MTNLSALDSIENPAWVLDVPIVDQITPPVDTRAQVLPFGDLSWQNFERLCLRLAKSDGDAEYWRLYGTAGQEQGGIDIYVRRTSTAKYAVWQSKRQKAFGPAKVKEAIGVFLASDWAKQSDRFVLCVQANLGSADTIDAIEESAQQLRAQGIEFIAMDGEVLSERLKQFPEIVADFFELAWVERFCGKVAALALKGRLAPKEFHLLRANLHKCYLSHIASVDPGVISQALTTSVRRTPISLVERFVQPDVLLERDREFLPASSTKEEHTASTSFDPALGMTYNPAPSSYSPQSDPRVQKTRTSFDSWINDVNREVILGTAGAGKSTLLRFLALDMLSESPALGSLRRRYPDFLPVWVSFAFWTKLISGDKERSSLIDAIEAWFRRQDEPEIIALIKKAFEDKRLFLLVDGIDEWDNETAGNTAIALLQAFAERHSVPVIMTGRPHGFRLIRGLDQTWRTAEIAAFTKQQQIELATTWFKRLEPIENSDEQNSIVGRRLATDFVVELGRNGPIAQLGTTPLLLTSLIALKVAQVRLPRNRFLAYAALAKMLVEIHPAARDRAALAGNPRYSADVTTREIALAALAFAIHTGNQSASSDTMDIDHGIDVVSQCIIERIGTSATEARQSARSILTLGEEEIGVLVKKSPREIGFFHRVFQEYFAAQYMASLEFSRQLELVQLYAVDPRWSDAILCLIHQNQRPTEVDDLLKKIEAAQGDLATLAFRDMLLAEAAFGEFRMSPKLAHRLADRALEQIELSRFPSTRRALAAQAIEGLSSPILSPKISEKLKQWFPRAQSYGLKQVFQAAANWPEDQNIAPALWRGLHDEYFDAAQAAAQSIAKRFGGQLDFGERLIKLISSPPNSSAAAVGIEALWRGWPEHQHLNLILDNARRSRNSAIAISAIRGRIAKGIRSDEDLSRLIDQASTGDFHSKPLDAALIEGWPGDDRLRDFATRARPEEERVPVRRPRPDFGLLVQGFPGDANVAALIANDFRQEHPHCLFDHQEFELLAANFKNNATVGPAVEQWVMKYRADDAFTLARAARIMPTTLFKAALLKCLNGGHLSFWAASALVDLWGPDDLEVRTALLAVAETRVDVRQNIAHVLPLVLSDKTRCRELLLEVVASPGRIRADFALQGLRILGVNAADQDATDRVLARGYNEERFVLENEVREVIRTFSDDDRVYGLATRQLRRPFGAIGTVAEVYAADAQMRQLVLEASGPLDVSMRLSVLDRLSERALFDPNARSLIAAAQNDEFEDIVVGSAISFARAKKATGAITNEYIAEVQGELDAIGPRLNGRRQAAMAALTVLDRLDLMPKGEPRGVRGEPIGNLSRLR